MIDPTRPGSTLSFASREWRSVSRPNGYRWDENEDLPKNFVKFCRTAAGNNKAMRSQFCAWWNVEGEALPGQPNWAYTGDFRLTPDCLPLSALKDGIAEFTAANVRVFCTVRHSRVVTDRFGRIRRDYGVDPFHTLCDVIDACVSFGFSGAYLDSGGVPGRRCCKPNVIRDGATDLVPPVIPAETIPRVFKALDVGPDQNPWGGGGFDLFAEFGDETYDNSGIPLWLDARGGDVRYPGKNLAQRKAYRARHPKAGRVIECPDDQVRRPERLDEFREALGAGGVLLFNGGVGLDSTDMMGTAWVYDRYAERFGWPTRA